MAKSTSNGKVASKGGVALRGKPAAPSKGKPAPAARGVKRVYFFGNGKAEGNANMKDLLGRKGANLGMVLTKARAGMPSVEQAL